MSLYYGPITAFDRLFDDAFAAQVCARTCAPLTGDRHGTSQHDTYRPRLDLYESKDTNTVTAVFELPGLTSDGVAIDIHQNRLTVSSEAPPPDSSEEEKNYVVRERRAGKFSRALQLPFGTKPEDVKAKMENGILTITFPKTSPEQEAKRIVIQ